MTGYKPTYPISFPSTTTITTSTGNNTQKKSSQVNVSCDEETERLKTFIETFYAVSDDASRDEEWLGFFKTDATLYMGEKKATGLDEIRELRKGMWEKVKSRKHTLEKVFPATFDAEGDENQNKNKNQTRKERGNGKIEYMINGSVDLEMKSGEKTAALWAARAVVVIDNDDDDEDEDGGGGPDGRLKYEFYQVYLTL